MEELGADAIPMFECLVWSFDAVFRYERGVFTFENVDDHEAEEVTIHFFLVIVGMNLQCCSLHSTIESFYEPIGLRSVWGCMTMRYTICFAYKIKCSLQHTLSVILPIASMIIECILFPIVCEYTSDLEWKKSNSRFQKGGCGICFLIWMKFHIHEPCCSINSNMDIVLHSVNLGSVCDIYMNESWFIFFEFSRDSFSHLFPLFYKSPELEMIVETTARKDDRVRLKIIFYLRYGMTCNLVEIVEKIEATELMYTMWDDRC